MGVHELPLARVAFGRAVERLRGKGRTQKDLAAAIERVRGRSSKYSKQGVISAVEHGKTWVAIEDVVTFATALDVAPADLLIAWAEELGEEDVAGWQLQRSRLLSDLDTLQSAVRKATAEFLVSRTKPASGSVEVQEGAALLAELMTMSKRQRRLVFRVVEMLNKQKEDNEGGQ